MNIIQRVAIGVTALALGGMAATTAVTAARTSPVPVIYQTFGNYRGPVMIRPGDDGLGADWGYNRAHWYRWNNSGAYGSAKEFVSAGATYPVYRWWVRITYSKVKHHHGRKYYSKLKMVGNPPPASRVKNVQHLVYRIPGGWFQV